MSWILDLIARGALVFLSVLLGSLAGRAVSLLCLRVLPKQRSSLLLSLILVGFLMVFASVAVVQGLFDLLGKELGIIEIVFLGIIFFIGDLLTAYCPGLVLRLLLRTAGSIDYTPRRCGRAFLCTIHRNSD